MTKRIKANLLKHIVLPTIVTLFAASLSSAVAPTPIPSSTLEPMIDPSTMPEGENKKEYTKRYIGMTSCVENAGKEASNCEKKIAIGSRKASPKESNKWNKNKLSCLELSLRLCKDCEAKYHLAFERTPVIEGMIKDLKEYISTGKWPTSPEGRFEIENFELENK